MKKTALRNFHFPVKLYQVMELEDDSIICWEEDGKFIHILNQERFEREILPKYFRHSRFSSLQRQLNLYGFKALNRGEDKGLFYHPHFRRGDFDAVRAIRRIVSPSITSPTNTPNNHNSDMTSPYDSVLTPEDSGSALNNNSTNNNEPMNDENGINGSNRSKFFNKNDVVNNSNNNNPYNNMNGMITVTLSDYYASFDLEHGTSNSYSSRSNNNRSDVANGGSPLMKESVLGSANSVNAGNELTKEYFISLKGNNKSTDSLQGANSQPIDCADSYYNNNRLKRSYSISSEDTVLPEHEVEMELQSARRFYNSDHSGVFTSLKGASSGNGGSVDYDDDNDDILRCALDCLAGLSPQKQQQQQFQQQQQQQPQQQLQDSYGHANFPWSFHSKAVSSSMDDLCVTSTPPSTPATSTASVSTMVPLLSFPSSMSSQTTTATGTGIGTAPLTGVSSRVNTTSRLYSFDEVDEEEDEMHTYENNNSGNSYNYANINKFCVIGDPDDRNRFNGDDDDEVLTNNVPHATISYGKADENEENAETHRQYNNDEVVAYSSLLSLMAASHDTETDCYYNNCDDNNNNDHSCSFVDDSFNKTTNIFWQKE